MKFNIFYHGYQQSKDLYILRHMYNFKFRHKDQDELDILGHKI